MKRIAPYLLIALFAAICLSLAYCVVREPAESSPAQTIQINPAELGVNANIADVRTEDAVRAEKQQREIEDAVANSTGPDDVRARRGCVILRQQGRDTSQLPACR